MNDELREGGMKALSAIVLAAAMAAAGAVLAAEKKDDPGHVRKDVADHRAMAEAHLNAAKCLEAGKPEKTCHEQLAKDCKGLAVGKYCGMKHAH
jgi:hypothetical protein